VTDEEVEPLAKVAMELAQRVRDDDPAAVGRWLAATLPDPADWWALMFVLAAAVPDDRSWQHSTAWTLSPGRHRGANELEPCGTRAAYRRHLAHGQDPCDACKEGNRTWERDRGRLRRAVDNTVGDAA
jgi:hypothetical protein